MATMYLRLSVNHLALTVGLAREPRLADLVPEEAGVQDPEINRCYVAVPHAALRTCADRLNPYRPMFLGGLLHHRPAGLDQVIAPPRRGKRVHERGQSRRRVPHKAV